MNKTKYNELHQNMDNMRKSVEEDFSKSFSGFIMDLEEQNKSKPFNDLKRKELDNVVTNTFHKHFYDVIIDLPEKTESIMVDNFINDVYIHNNIASKKELEKFVSKQAVRVLLNKKDNYNIDLKSFIHNSSYEMIDKTIKDAKNAVGKETSFKDETVRLQIAKGLNRFLNGYQTHTIYKESVSHNLMLTNSIDDLSSIDMVFTAHIDESTTTICLDLDKKVDTFENFQKNKEIPSLHYNCRSKLIPKNLNTNNLGLFVPYFEPGDDEDKSILIIDEVGKRQPVSKESFFKVLNEQKYTHEQTIKNLLKQDYESIGELKSKIKEATEKDLLKMKKELEIKKEAEAARKKELNNNNKNNQ